MGFHDKAARIAAEKGRTAADFTEAAQRHSTASWIFAIAAVGLGYFVHWAAGLVVGALAAYKAIQSISSTLIAERIEKQ